jgi:hypothetical protein
LAIRSTASKVTVVIPPETPEIYANFTQAFVSEWDFLIVMGSTRLATNETNQLTPTARADVLIRMSPQHTKAMIATLSELIDNYERDHGVLGKESASDDIPNSEPPRTRQRRRNAT